VSRHWLAIGALVLLSGSSRPSTFTVTTAADVGRGSLREALTKAAKNAGPDTILFAPSLAGQLIRPLTPLPTLGDAGTEINGDADGNGGPDVALDGSLLHPSWAASGLRVTADDCTIRALVLSRFPAYQVDALDGPGTKIVGCYINTNVSGTQSSFRASDAGISIGDADQVGGPGEGERNVICVGSAIGIRMMGRGALVANNWIGVPATGQGTFAATREGTGIWIGSG